MDNNQTNLLLDPTGDKIMEYQPQNQDYYFLTGAYGSNQSREVVIPADKGVLVPVLNGFAGCDTCNMMQRVFRMNDLGDDINHAITMKAELDGKPIAFERLKTDVFELQIKEHNPFLYLKPYIGKTVPVIADGYWVVVNPGELKPDSQHTLMTHGVDKNGYSTEVRYNIEVK